jgi:hypothetical protein
MYLEAISVRAEKDWRDYSGKPFILKRKNRPSTLLKDTRL